MKDSVVIPESIVAKGMEMAAGARWLGVPVVDLSRNELLAAFGNLLQQQAVKTEIDRRYERFMHDVSMKFH